MSHYDDTKKRLKVIYEYCSAKNRWDLKINRDTYWSMPEADRNDIRMHFIIMQQEGWVEPFSPSIGTPYSFKLTAKGIKAIEDILENSVVHTSNYTVLNATNNIIGDNPHNTGVTFEELRLLVEKNLSNQSDRKEVLDVLNNLQERINSGKPIEQGFLTKINDKLEKCSWLNSGIVSQIIQYFTKSN